MRAKEEIDRIDADVSKRAMIEANVRLKERAEAAKKTTEEAFARIKARGEAKIAKRLRQ